MTDETTPPESKSGSFLERLRYWLSVIPGTKRDYFLISIAFIDVILIMFSSTYLSILPEDYTPLNINYYLLSFDYLVMSIWGLEFLRRITKQENKWEYLKHHWYEVLGLIPLSQLRILLLARALKLAIAYYKLGKSEKNVSRLLTQEFTFRFRDVIVDTISDAVFQQSLRRVEEVMLRLNYSALAREIVQKHEPELRQAIMTNIEKKSLIGDLRNIPLMGSVATSIASSVADSVLDVIQEDVLGDVFHDITAKILSDMHARLKELDVLRITAQPSTDPAATSENNSPNLTETPTSSGSVADNPSDGSQA